MHGRVKCGFSAACHAVVTLLQNIAPVLHYMYAVRSWLPHWSPDPKTTWSNTPWEMAIRMPMQSMLQAFQREGEQVFRRQRGGLPHTTRIRETVILNHSLVCAPCSLIQHVPMRGHCMQLSPAGTVKVHHAGSILKRCWFNETVG